MGVSDVTRSAGRHEPMGSHHPVLFLDGRANFVSQVSCDVTVDALETYKCVDQVHGVR